jgi:hypothetical protein
MSSLRMQNYILKHNIYPSRQQPPPPAAAWDLRPPHPVPGSRGQCGAVPGGGGGLWGAAGAPGHGSPRPAHGSRLASPPPRAVWPPECSQVREQLLTRLFTQGLFVGFLEVSQQFTCSVSSSVTYCFALLSVLLVLLFSFLVICLFSVWLIHRLSLLPSRLPSV